jgi:FKBP-type peptidyl-prolyl cis-trans isomerase FkpA
MVRSWVMLVAMSTIAFGCKPSAPPAAAPAPPPAAISELQKTDLAEGTGEPVASGQVAVVHYTGWLYDPDAKDNKGRKFDSSRDRGEPFAFLVGAGKVIRGWDEGVAGMKVGGQRRLVIPASLGYGDSEAGSDIPPGATLVFDVELLGIQPATAPTT